MTLCFTAETRNYRLSRPVHAWVGVTSCTLLLMLCQVLRPTVKPQRKKYTGEQHNTITVEQGNRCPAVP